MGLLGDNEFRGQLGEGLGCVACGGKDLQHGIKPHPNRGRALLHEQIGVDVVWVSLVETETLAASLAFVIWVCEMFTYDVAN